MMTIQGGNSAIKGDFQSPDKSFLIPSAAKRGRKGLNRRNTAFRLDDLKTKVITMLKGFSDMEN